MAAPASKTPAHDDAELVRRVCDGDESAAATLFGEVLGPLLACLGRHWQYPELEQDLFLHLQRNRWAALRTWTGRASLKAWVRTVAYRMRLAKLRRARIPVGDVDAIPSSEEPVVERIARNETWLGVLMAIERLESPAQRIVLRMCFLQSMNPDEIATQLNISVSLVYTHKSRALTRLRSLLEVAL